MERSTFHLIRKAEEPKVVLLKDYDDKVFGAVREITSRATGAEGANASEVILWGADIIHSHGEAEETYEFKEGAGEIFLNEEIFKVDPGDRVIIKPGTLHAVRPKKDFPQVKFRCVASPAFDPSDVYEDARRRSW